MFWCFNLHHARKRRRWVLILKALEGAGLSRREFENLEAGVVGTTDPEREIRLSRREFENLEAGVQFVPGTCRTQAQSSRIRES